MTRHGSLAERLPPNALVAVENFPRLRDIVNIKCYVPYQSVRSAFTLVFVYYEASELHRPISEVGERSETVQFANICLETKGQKKTRYRATDIQEHSIAFHPSLAPVRKILSRVDVYT